MRKRSRGRLASKRTEEAVWRRCPLVGAQRAGFSSNDFRRWSDHRKTVVIVSSTHPQGSWAHAGARALPAAR